jgi:hypothetical protein
MRRYKRNPKVAELDEVFVNLFTKVPMAIFRILLSPWAYIAFSLWAGVYFLFIFGFAFFFTYLPAKIYHFIGLGPSL